jgi:hypothetical protein
MPLFFFKNKNEQKINKQSTSQIDEIAANVRFISPLFSLMTNQKTADWRILHGSE